MPRMSSAPLTEKLREEEANEPTVGSKEDAQAYPRCSRRTIPA